jgi:hypothetical protein
VNKKWSEIKFNGKRTVGHRPVDCVNINCKGMVVPTTSQPIFCCTTTGCDYTVKATETI